MKNIAVMASGEGTNAENLARYFERVPDIDIALIISNRCHAPVLKRAERRNIKTVCMPDFSKRAEKDLLPLLKKHNVEYIVLAGFLKLIPPVIIKAYPDKIINLHPTLLPKFAGKGMYGMNVHKAVLDAGEKETGITIHYVNEHYDRGKIIAQYMCPVMPGDTTESLAERVHKLEYKHFPIVIERVVRALI